MYDQIQSYTHVGNNDFDNDMKDLEKLPHPK